VPGGTGKLVQINVSPGGMPKLPVAGSVRVTVDGVPGDWQKNRKYHGGPDRAICLFSTELYAELANEGIELAPGGVGENFTTQGVDLKSLSKGSQLRIGESLIEITDVRTPCRNLNQWHPRLLQLMKGRSGWVCKVVDEGLVKAGDRVELV
jgi:MOSC domain-containing protein YiiM